MRECALSQKEAVSLTDKGEVLFNSERFKQRMGRWMETADELWDEYEELKKYSLRQKE
jgi:hypothetical protein